MSANGKNAKTQGKQTAPGSKRPAKNPRPGAAGSKGKTAPTAKERRRREISGIALIALGLFLALTHLGSTGVVGEKVTGFAFGLTGVFAYVLPVVLIAQGFYAIATAGKRAALPRFMLIVAVMLMALSFIHIFFMDRIESDGYISFLWNSFALGESVEAGGGLLGGLLSYPSVILLGRGGSYVLFPALALILIVALTNISLQRTGKKVGRVIKQNVSAVSNHIEQIKEVKKEKREQRRLNTEELSIIDADLAEPKLNRAEEPIKEAPAATDDVDILPEKGKIPVASRIDPATPPIRPSTFRRMPVVDDLEAVEGALPRYATDEQAKNYVKTVLSETDGRYEPAASSIAVEPEDQQETGQSVVSGGTDQGGTIEADTGEDIIRELVSRDFGDYEKYLPPLNGFDPDETPDYQTDLKANDPAVNFDSGVRELDFLIPDGPVNHGGGSDAESVSSPPEEPLIIRPLETAPQKKEGGDQLSIEDSSSTAKEAPCYVPPPVSLLSFPKNVGVREDPMQKAKLLEQALASFGISAKVTDVVQGPVITRYELQPAPGVRVNRITNLSDDIALHLAAPRVRIQAPIPGKSVIGIEVPNKVNATVTLREVVASPEFQSSKSPLSIALGKDISGKLAMADIAKMPHLLIAGSTGSGKSVCINCIICSIIYHASPEDVRMIMIDPKVVELSVFSNIPHLLVPVVTEPKQAAGALRWAVNEMIQRYNQFKKKGARELTRYNELMAAEGQQKLPSILVIVDELADLMMVAPDEVEDSICRIAQLGRAAGIHLVVATQRPSADVITGLIKANILTRIAFAVASSTDSRIILDATGAEKLLGKGDMLFSHSGGEPKRIQGALVTDTEVEKIHQYFESNKGMGTIDESVSETIASGKIPGSESSSSADFEDELLPEAVEIFLGSGQASISMLQRRMRVGYNRAARLIDIMEQMGIVSGFEGSKPRKLLIGRAQFEELFGRPPDLPDLGS
ncbi:MAG: DNA translocase FtsK 4TM domain-containing protein [Christensenellales bacterium]